METDAEVESPGAVLDVAAVDDAALRAGAVVPARMDEPAALRLPDAAELERRPVVNGAEDGSDTSVLRDVRRIRDLRVVLDHELAVPLEQRPELRARREGRAESPADAIGNSVSFGVATKDATDDASQFRRAPELTTAYEVDVTVPVVGAGPAGAGRKLHHHPWRDAHRIAAPLLEHAPLATNDGRTSEVLRPATPHVRELVRYAAERRVGPEDRSHVTVQTHDSPRSEQLEPVSDADRASHADLIDVGQSLLAIVIGAKHAEGPLSRGHRFRRGNKPQTRVAVDRRKCGTRSGVAFEDDFVRRDDRA